MDVLSPLAREHAPWSISKAGVAKTCPRQFQYKYLMRAPQSTPSRSNVVGLHAHAILEARLQGKSAAEAKLSADARFPLTYEEAEDLKPLLPAIESFLRRLGAFERKIGATRRLIEHQWALDEFGGPVAWDAKTVFIRGVVDLGIESANSDLYVIDHKGGRVKPLDEFRMQVESYAIGLLASDLRLHGFRGAVHFLQGHTDDERLQWFDYLTREEIVLRVWPALIAHINQAAARLVPPLVGQPSKKWPCAWCNYRGTCPEYREAFGGT